MSISFEILNNELLFCYSPEMGIEYIHDGFKDNDDELEIARALKGSNLN